MDRNGLNRYVKRVKKALNGRKDEKNQILANLKSDLEDYVQEHPNATEQEILDRFGKPEEYAETTLSALSGETLRKKVSRSGFGFKVWMLIIAITVVLFILTLVGIIIYNKHHTVKYYSEEITEYSVVTEEEFPDQTSERADQK